MHAHELPLIDLPPADYRKLKDAGFTTDPLRFLARLLWLRFRRNVGLAVLCTMGGIGLMSLEPIFLARLVDALRLGRMHDPWSSAVWLPFCLVTGAWVASAMFNRLGEVVDLRTHPRVREEVQVYLFSWLIDHSPDYFHRNFAGQLAAKVKQAGTSAISILGLVTNDVVRVVLAVAIGVLIIGFDHPWMALMVLVWTPLYVGVSVRLARRRKVLSKDFQDQVARSTGVIVDLVKNSDLVRSFAKSRDESCHVAQALEKEAAASRRLRWFATGMNAVLYTGMQVFQIALVGASVYLAARGRMQVGETVKMLSLATLLMNNIWGAASRMLDLLEHTGHLASALEMILKPHAIADRDGFRPLQVRRGEIDIQALYFGYDGKRVFDGLSLHIPAAQKVALVGPSGSGKTTLIKILRRDYLAQAGRVLIDSQDIALATQESINQAIAEIPQQPGLFHRSIRDNIRYARPDADDAEVVWCAQAAHADDFIASRSLGYQALVGEQGIQLSGGERQRVAIARALLKNAPILVLDEATASLDSETEHVIHEALWRLFQGRTVIAIAHRLSTIARMDRILFIEDGHIVEDGTHPQLLALNGRYARAWRRQVDGFLA